MRICLVWDADYPWDVRLEKVASKLSEGGHEVHIVARNRKGGASAEVLPEGTVHRLAPLPFGSKRLDDLTSFPAFVNPRWLAKIFQTARDTRAEMIIVRDLPLAPAAHWAARRLKIPIILDMAENYPAMIQAIWDAGRQRRGDVLVRNPTFARMVEDWVLPRMDHTLVVVEESRTRLVAKGVAPDRVTVVSNTPPLAREANPANGNNGAGPLRLVYLGLLEEPRGIGVVIDGMAKARARGLSLQLDIIGDGRERNRFEAQARAAGLLGETVRFHGFLPYAIGLKHIQASDVGVVPHFANESWSTTIPNKLFDYMAAGLAVLASSVPPVARVIRDASCGEVFADRDAEDFVEKVSRLADADYRHQCGASGRSAVLDRYNWEVDGARMLEVLKRFEQD